MSATALVLAAVLAQAPGDRFALPGAQATTACPSLGQDLQRASSPHWIGPRERAAASRRPLRATVSRLGDLPKANLTLTVLRSVDGCAVSSTTRYEVEGDGRAPH